ncbi:MAG: FAD-dependent oxidoreductase [Pseudomonadota bacterium]
MTKNDGAQIHVGIVGAGVAGLSAASRLSARGHRISLFDKSKGLGGRLATRRSDAGDFDHGAPGFTVGDPAFSAHVAEIAGDGGATAWPDGAGFLLTHGEGPIYTGVPGASGFARTMAMRLPDTVTHHPAVTVTPPRRSADGWHVAGVTVDALVIAVPAPQAAALLAEAHPALSARAASVTMTAVASAMIGYVAPVAPERVQATLPSGIIAKAIPHSAKPWRDAAPMQRWVLHAGSGWSADHIDESKEAIAAALADAFCGATGAPPPDHAAGHRWRYAYAASPLGEAAPGDDATRLALAGDWCLGDGVEHAWLSGQAGAARLIEALV